MKNTNTNPQRTTIANDLESHFKERMSKVVFDYIDSCDRMDLDRVEAVTVVLAASAYHLVGAALALDASEREYLRICQSAYRELHDHFTGEKENEK